MIFLGVLLFCIGTFTQSPSSALEFGISIVVSEEHFKKKKSPQPHPHLFIELVSLSIANKSRSVP